MPDLLDDLGGLLVTLLGDQIVALLGAAIERLELQGEPIPEAERAVRLAKLDREIIELELKEETMIRASEEEGRATSPRGL